MSYRKLPQDLRQRIFTYYDIQYQGRWYNEEEILSEMSEPLKEEVKHHLCARLVKKVPLIQHCDLDFLNAVIMYLNIELFQPREVIIVECSYGDRMYFLEYGRVLIESKSMTKELKAGDYFGELFLLKECARSMTVTALTMCHLFSLSGDELKELLEAYPEIGEEITKCAIHDCESLIEQVPSTSAAVRSAPPDLTESRGRSSSPELKKKQHKSPKAQYWSLRNLRKLLIHTSEAFFSKTVRQRPGILDISKGDQKLASFSTVCQDDGTWHRHMPQCENTYNCSAQGSWADQDGHEDIPVCLPVIYRCSASRKWVSEEMGTELPACVPVCGIPSTPIEEQQRIFGGTRAKPGNFPWQVLFQNPRGGGVLISAHWVLTAAHVLDDSNSKPTMYAGVTNINQQLQKEEPMQLFEEEVFIHPNWTKVANPEARTNFDNDIALLRLTVPVKMGPKISPLCLPGDSPEYELEKGRLGYISGWGQTEDRSRVYHLMKVQIPVVDMAQCRSVKLKPPADSTTFQFTDNMVCAGDGTKNSCSGDGGGAYAIKDPHNDRQYYVGGLVSWGPRCGTYGLYTRVGRYRDWIMGTMS
ncbi:protein canopy-like protein 2 [Platysternon megacephalum]|uniref:Protein canopy-like protein 2 n=1 Tax=Platysternon megacephalum TaxID=55544 RepID=A0A4D9EBZ4_9SAUR|nr:protein canopy-like protein 2 [Platysternon megacephalum]